LNTLVQQKDQSIKDAKAEAEGIRQKYKEKLKQVRVQLEQEKLKKATVITTVVAEDKDSVSAPEPLTEPLTETIGSEDEEDSAEPLEEDQPEKNPEATPEVVAQVEHVPRHESKKEKKHHKKKKRRYHRRDKPGWIDLHQLGAELARIKLVCNALEIVLEILLQYYSSRSMIGCYSIATVSPIQSHTTQYLIL
jgi:hypothetical protein